MQRVLGPPFGSIPLQSSIPFRAGLIPRGPFPPVGSLSNGFSAASTMRGGGGFLSRLFGGGAAAGRFSSSGLTGGTNFTTILTNTQRVLGLTQQVTPMVRQYGPIIRNLPAIWRILREPDLGSAEEDLTEENSEELAAQIPVQSANENEVTPPEPIQHDASPKSINGYPLPKLYI
ncbi:hypothetical protein GN156_07895 [bacterium LRH843]|nr:hypothetical protein [bacterium LRH843]